MPIRNSDRKRRFLAALAFAEMSMAEWAAGEGVTAGHVSQVLSGKRESESLCEKIDRFTQKQQDRMTQTV